MLKYHDETFRTFPRRSADIHPNLNVFEEFPMPGPTRGEWVLVLAALAAIVGTIVTVAVVFLG